VPVVVAGARLRGAATAPMRMPPVPTGPSTDAVVLQRRRAWPVRARPTAPNETAMAVWCEHVARGMRTGSSLRRAMADAGLAAPAAAQALSPALGRLDRGMGLGNALGAMDDDPSTPVGLVVGVLAACADLGGPAAAPLDRTAATLHARAVERDERRTASAQARLSARVLTTLPIATLGVMALVEPSTRTAVATPAGVTCLTAGATFNLAGWWWMRHVIARST
jgi:tight adherence protein B